MVAFVPVCVETLAELRLTPLPGPVLAFAPTPGLYDTFSLPATADEEAERTTLLLAGLSALITYGARLVVVVEADVADGSALGECSLGGLDWRSVSAIFADAPEAVRAVTAAAGVMAGLDLADAWDLDEARILMSEHDLLWYGPEEVDVLLGA